MAKAGSDGEHSRLLQALASGTAVALLVLLLRQLGWLDLWELETRDYRTRWTHPLGRPEGAPPARSDIRLVMVTDETLRLVKKNNDMSWPWDWDAHAVLLQGASEGKAVAVLFDFLLLEAREGHQELAAALKAWPHVWFAGSFREIEDSASTPRPDQDALLARFAIEVDSDGSVEVPSPYEKVVLPASEIAGSLAGVCDISTPRDPDGGIRRYRLLSRHRDRFYPSFALAGLLEREKTRKVSIRNRALRVGGMSVPVERDGCILLRYYYGNNSFDWTPAWNVFRRMGGDRAAKFDPRELEGSVVIMGTSASGMTDLRITPVSDVMPGPEIHAIALANVLNADYLREVPAAMSVLAVLVLSLGTALLVRHSSAAAGGAGSAGLLLLGGVGSLLLYRARWAAELVSPMASVVLAFASTSAVNFLYEGRQRLRTKREFMRYMSPKVVEKVLQNPDALSMSGERKPVTIFFMDFAGFTSMSEKLDAVEVVKLMNDYHNEAAEEIFRTEGTLDKFIGDAIMAFWNDPIEQPDHALRACLTAIEAQKRLLVMAGRMRERGLPAMTARIGINTGVATIGNMGARVQFQYTAIGDEVNLASRLEGVNKEFGTKIIVAESTWKAVKDRVEARELALIKVKGRRAPVRIYDLLGLRDEVPSEAAVAARAFEQALHALHGRRFAEAREAFAALAATGDAASVLYEEVCARYLESPPPADWDGSYQMEHK